MKEGFQTSKTKLRLKIKTKQDVSHKTCENNLETFAVGGCVQRTAGHG